VRSLLRTCVFEDMPMIFEGPNVGHASVISSLVVKLQRLRREAKSKRLLLQGNFRCQFLSGISTVIVRWKRIRPDPVLTYGIAVFGRQSYPQTCPWGNHVCIEGIFGYSAVLVPLRKMAPRIGMSFHLTCHKRSSVGLSRFEPFHRRFIVQLKPNECPERWAKNRCQMRECHE
jgi:hypothetical protein